jgi:hypothetical protein
MSAFVRRIRQRGLGECVVASMAHGSRLLGDGSGFSALEAKYLVKNADDESETLATFLVDANSLERRIAIAVQSRHLSKTLSDIVKRSALGETRGAIAEARGTSVKTDASRLGNARDDGRPRRRHRRRHRRARSPGRYADGQVPSPLPALKPQLRRVK